MMGRVQVLDVLIWRRYGPTTMPEMSLWITTDREAWFIRHILLGNMIRMSTAVSIEGRIALSERGGVRVPEVVSWPVGWMEISCYRSRQRRLVSVGHGKWVAV